MKRRDQPSNMKRPRASTLFSLSLALSIVIGWGCDFEEKWVAWTGDPLFNFNPEYFCSGDPITVTWNKNLDRQVLLTNEGVELLSTRSPSGTAIVEIDGGMLPLKEQAYARDRRVADRNAENLINVDNPTWTRDLPAVEVEVPSSRRFEPDGTETITLEDGTVLEVPKYKIYARYQGFTWRAGEHLPTFSPQAKIDRIRNVTGPTLDFRSYVPGAAIIDAGADADIDPDWDATISWFNGNYTPRSIEREWGFQRGDPRKPEDPWFLQQKTYQEATAIVNLLVFCDQP